jgi:tetratricopeptide (TPR) repeat protein
MNRLEEALANYIKDTRNPIFNFTLGKCYEDERQFAAAIGFYIRTAEFGDNKLLSYEAFLRIAICFELQGRRNYTMKGVLLRAITILPDRPEAYFLMSRTYEINKDWHEAYAWSIVGKKIADEDKYSEPLITDVQYPGKYGFIYERAVVSWWIGLYYESLNLFRLLDNKYKMYPIHEESVKNNIKTILNLLKKKGKYNKDNDCTDGCYILND